MAKTWNNRGTVLNDLKRYEEALSDFDKAIGLNPNYAEAFSIKANPWLRSIATMRRWPLLIGRWL